MISIEDEKEEIFSFFNNFFKVKKEEEKKDGVDDVEAQDCSFEEEY